MTRYSESEHVLLGKSNLQNIKHGFTNLQFTAINSHKNLHKYKFQGSDVFIIFLLLKIKLFLFF